MGKAVKVSKTAEDTTFIDSHIEGDIEVEGKGTSFIRTSIGSFQKQSKWLQILEVGVSVITLVFAILQIV